MHADTNTRTPVHSNTQTNNHTPETIVSSIAGTCFLYAQCNNVAKGELLAIRYVVVSYCGAQKA